MWATASIIQIITVMLTSTIKICGKDVHVAYCYATEIAFHNYTGVSVDKFDAENPQHTVYLIMASIFAYYNSKSHEGEDHDLTDEGLIYESKPEEIVAAFKTVLELRQKWYGVDGAAAEERPTEPGTDADEDAGKN